MSFLDAMRGLNRVMAEANLHNHPPSLTMKFKDVWAAETFIEHTLHKLVMTHRTDLNRKPGMLKGTMYGMPFEVTYEEAPVGAYQQIEPSLAIVPKDWPEQAGLERGSVDGFKFQGNGK